MGRALSFFINRELSRGWMGWRATYEEAARKLSALRRGLSHMLNRKLSAGWGSWTAMVEERQRFLQLLRRGLSFMLMRRQAMGFAGWRAAHDFATGRSRQGRPPNTNEGHSGTRREGR